MRIKQLWDYFPLPRNLKLIWERLTSSRLTVAYVVFSLIHCFIQVGLQSWAFSINDQAAISLSDQSVVGVLAINGHVIPELSGETLSLCQDVPSRHHDANCTVIWSDSTGQQSQLSMATGSQLISSIGKSSSTPTLTRRSETLKFSTFEEDVRTRIQVVNAANGTSETLSLTCRYALNWPVAILDNTKREDITFIAFQVWVLGMSIVALLNESMPHIFASLLTHMLATAWSGYQISHTADFRHDFNTVVSDGACDGVSLLPEYWSQRARAEFPILALNILALFISAFLTWRLIKVFGWQTFKRVGASLTINRIYKLVLTLSIVLQLSFFFIAVTTALWLDSLFNGVAAETAWYIPFYKASSFAVLFFLIPWIATGWVSIRRELRIPMFAFLFLSVLYLAGWSIMFLSDSFRYTFVTWAFFSVMAVTSVCLTVVSFILGVICRYNFGKGLPRYLNAQEPLPGDDFDPVIGDMEKVAFPSNEKPIPTFSAAFGKGPEVPIPTSMFPSRMGPRFFNSSAEPFEAPRNVSPISTPSTALTRTSFNQSVTVVRNDTRSSEKSVGSIASYYSYSSDDSSHAQGTSGSDHSMAGKRWVID